MLQNVAQLIFGANGKPFPVSSFISNTSIDLENSSISIVPIITVLISEVSMILLFIVIKYLKIGKAMRAVSEDLETLQLPGINVRRLCKLNILYRFFINQSFSFSYFIKPLY